jgi:hypothetical protein
MEGTWELQNDMEVQPLLEMVVDRLGKSRDRIAEFVAHLKDDHWIDTVGKYMQACTLALLFTAPSRL